MSFCSYGIDQTQGHDSRTSYRFISAEDSDGNATQESVIMNAQGYVVTHLLAISLIIMVSLSARSAELAIEAGTLSVDSHSKDTFFLLPKAPQPIGNLGIPDAPNADTTINEIAHAVLSIIKNGEVDSDTRLEATISTVDGKRFVNGFTLKVIHFDHTASYYLRITNDVWAGVFGKDEILLYKPDGSIAAGEEDEGIPFFGLSGLQLPQLFNDVEASVDIKAVMGNSGDDRKGFDYNVSLSRQIGASESPSAFSLQVLSKGFISTADPDSRALSQITNEMNGRYSFFDYTNLWGDLHGLNTPEKRNEALNNATGYTVPELRKAFSRSRLMSLDIKVNGRTESDQRLDDMQYALGAGVDFLHSDLWWIGYPIAVLRPRGLARFKAPRFYAGIDGVFDAESSERELANAKSEFARFRCDVRWDNEIFQKTWLYSEFQLFWEIDAGRGTRARDIDVLTLLEVGIRYYVWKENAWFTVKYITGKLPVSEQKDEQIAAGIGFGF